MKLFLDDERFPPISNDGWDIVRSYDEFVHYIETNPFPAVISFDHDLGIGKTGMDCARWLVEWMLDNDEPQF